MRSRSQHLAEPAGDPRQIERAGGVDREMRCEAGGRGLVCELYEFGHVLGTGVAAGAGPAKADPVKKTAATINEHTNSILRMVTSCI